MHAATLIMQGRVVRSADPHGKFEESCDAAWIKRTGWINGQAM